MWRLDPPPAPAGFRHATSPGLSSLRTQQSLRIALRPRLRRHAQTPSLVRPDRHCGSCRRACVGYHSIARLSWPGHAHRELRARHNLTAADRTIMRILLVEDDLQIGQSLLRALKDADYSVDWVRDGIAGRDAMANAEYTVVLLDLGLPGMSGIELLKSSRAAGNA